MKNNSLKNPGKCERYRLRGGGVIALNLFQNDSISFIDPEGQAWCELIALDTQGRPATEAFGTEKAGQPSSSFLQLLLNGGEESEQLFQTLKQKGLELDIERCRSLKIFAGSDRPRTEVTLKVQRDIVCLIGNPGADMMVDEQNPATEIEVAIERASPLSSSSSSSFLSSLKRSPLLLPPPFFESRLETLINPGHAYCYEVKAGEYIQIIDVEGKQCSDFQAFDRQALEGGQALSLDMATTRTLIGLGYPKPGLYSKFFDANMQPLVEVVRDTVGRHDSFALACTAKYYEDQGYPGHANCSDNFNRMLKPYGIEERPGWPAINFFYNTGLDRNFVLYFDEPWSRPGDYVLLRALKDLVCISSSCPDDIDPANGWNPTDIGIRIYPPTKTLSKGIAYRMQPESIPQLTQESAFHPRTSQLTQSFTEYRNFWLPICFSGSGHGPIEEYYACREKAVVMDLSALRKFEILGPDAEVLLQRTLTRNIRKMSVGQVVYTALCHETGGMLDDGTLFRLGANGFRWICGSDYSGVWLRQQAEKMGLEVTVKTSTPEIHNLALQGPRSREILKEIIWTRPDQPKMEALKWFRFLVGRLGDFNGVPVVISRTGYSGELGYEIWCHPKHALPVWDAVWEAGEKHGMVPLGLNALDMLRIESGLIFADYEFTDQIDPFEAGIGFAVALGKDKEEDFIGKEALIRRKEHPQNVLVGLELEGQELGNHGDCIHVGRNQVGVITSGTRSPILQKTIALARVAVEHSALGTEVEVGKLDGHQKRIKAKVVRFPFYDPEKLRPRS